ncbi:MAG: VPLPA-CTERM sorting domain-containing protein [Pseudomonadota bacterium]
MMKRWMMCLLVGCLVAFLGGNCWGAAVDNRILLVDGNLDAGTDVKFDISGWALSDWKIGEMIGDTFTSFTFESDGYVLKEGGDIINFAIENIADSTKKWSLNATQNSLAFTGIVLFSGQLSTMTDSEPYKPNDVEEWYRTIIIPWSPAQLTIEVVTAGGRNDGMTTVPIPTTAFLLGTGVLGLVGVRRKFMK